MSSCAANDYESFSYLTPGVDFPTFDLAETRGRVSAYDLDLDEEQAGRTHRLLSKSIVISFHDHPQILPRDVSEIQRYYHSGRQITAYVVARSVQDILDAKRDGHIAFIMGTESAGPIENELDRIDVLYGFGIRQMGIAYSESNTLGSGLKERGDGGLTAFGRLAVERMNRIGMAIDVSHSSDRTCLDVVETSSKPVLITHAGARNVWRMPRMKPDEVLQACAQSGGVVGMSAAPHTTLSEKHPHHSLESVMDHFVYCAELVGIEHVAFGPDTLYGDHVGLHHAFADRIGVHQSDDPSAPTYEAVPYVAGLENPTENFFNITGWLVKHRYSDAEITAVLGGNILRVLEDIW